MPAPTAIDLFAGCGGLSLGFQMGGFDILRSYDHWTPAVETCRRNFRHPVEMLKLDEGCSLQHATVIVGGPPCQGFSSAGRRLPGDERNTLVRVFAALVVRHRPLAFVFENVEGFLTQAGGRFVLDLLEPLVSAGYRIHLRKVNAAHYGVPQHRKRVLVVGGLGWDPRFPAHTHCLPSTPTVRQALDGLPSAMPLEDCRSPFDHDYAPFGEMDLQRARLLQPGQIMRDLPAALWHPSYRRRMQRRVMDGTPTERRGGAPAGLRRLSPDQPSKAITGGALRDFVHPFEDRPLTIRECARLQGFPDDFLFVGTSQEKVQMIGNAVPVALAQQIASTLKEDLCDAQSRDGHGAMLSFICTFAETMSPALRAVSTKVKKLFL